MNQLSLRGFDKELERKLRELARREGVTFNEAALLLMRRGAGLLQESGSHGTVGDALDEFVGRWSEADEQNLLESITVCESVGGGAA